MTANTVYATQPYPSAATARALLICVFASRAQGEAVFMDENVHGSAYVVSFFWGGGQFGWEQ